MSAEAIQRAFDSRAEGNHKLVLVALAHRLPETSTIDDLTSMTRLSRLTVDCAVKALNRMGEIARVSA